ncbi:hypothetical protein Tco_1380716 [Tanacetum coccineum]
MFQHCGTLSIAWSLVYGTYSGHGSNDSLLPLVLRVGLSIRGATSKRNATWLILPVVICLSQTVSYHKLYDILKQHQNEVNEIRTERLARTANPLAIVAQQQPVYHHQNHPTQNTQYSSTRSQQSTRNKGKAIVTSSAPTYDPEPDTFAEDDEISKDKEIDKLMALISLSFKKIYKPTNNNL